MTEMLYCHASNVVSKSGSLHQVLATGPLPQTVCAQSWPSNAWTDKETEIVAKITQLNSG